MGSIGTVSIITITFILLLLVFLMKKITLDTLLVGLGSIIFFVIQKGYFHWFALVISTVIIVFIIPMVFNKNKSGVKKGRRAIDLLAFWLNVYIFFIISKYNFSLGTYGLCSGLSFIIFDVCASEVELFTSKRYIFIPHFQKVPKGTSGAVSLNGFVAGGLSLVVFSTLIYFVIIDKLLVISLIILISVITNVMESLMHQLRTYLRFRKLPNQLTNLLFSLFSGFIVALLTWSLL